MKGRKMNCCNIIEPKTNDYKYQKRIKYRKRLTESYQILKD